MSNTDRTLLLDDLTWSSPVLALEPRPIPRFADPAPDPRALWDAISRQAQDAGARLQWERLLLRRIKRMRTTGVVLLLLSLMTLGVIAFGQVTGEIDGYVVQSSESESEVEVRDGQVVRVSDDTSPVAVLAAVLLFTSAIAAAVCFAMYSRARDPSSNAGLAVGAALLVAGCCTMGVVPLVVSLYMLLSKPRFRWPDGSISRLDSTVLSAAASRQRTIDQLEQLAADPQARFQAELARAQAAHAAARAQHDQHYASLQRFDPIPPLPEPDLICIGGSLVERTEVVHHLVGSLRQAGPVWVIDLSPTASLHKALEWSCRDPQAGLLEASDDSSLHWHLDQLVRQRTGRRVLLIDVLIDAFAPTEGDSGGASRRDIVDTLQRIADVFDECGQDLSLLSLYEGVQVLLASARHGRASAPSDDGSNDFGAIAPSPAPRDGLDPAVVEMLRTEFTDDERREYLREWSDIRRKLRALRASSSSPPEPPRPWQPDAPVNLAFVRGTLAADDLQLRRGLLVGLCRNLLRAEGGPAVGSIVVAGADHLDDQQVLDLSNLAEAAGVTLATVFAELTPTARRFARGRRSLAVLGGLGAEAAEELSTMLGMDWTERAQSYQSTWSDAESESRAETSGRSWSTTSTDGRTKTWGSTSGEHGASTSSSDQRSSSTAETDGGSFSETSTTGTTHTEGGSATTVREYEQVARGSEISRLAPFTALLRYGSEVRFVDFNGSIAVEPRVAEAAAQLRPARRGSSRIRPTQ